MARAAIATAKTEVAATGRSELGERLERTTGIGLDRVDEALALGAGTERSEELILKQAEIGLQVLRLNLRADTELFRQQSDERFLTVLEQLSRVEALPIPGKKS